jgi:hypothetical protein
MMSHDAEAEEILAMKLNDLQAYVLMKIEEMGLFSVDKHLLVRHNRIDYFEFLALYVHPKLKYLLLSRNTGSVMTGMFQDDERDSATTDQKF